MVYNNSPLSERKSWHYKRSLVIIWWFVWKIQLNGAFVKFIEWAKADPFWSTREKSERQRFADIKAELLEEQKEVIKLIQECECRAKEELQLAKNVLDDIKTL